MKIKKATFWDIDYSNNVADDKSAIDKLNEYIVENKISKCDVINVETRGDRGHSRCLNLFYWEDGDERREPLVADHYKED